MRLKLAALALSTAIALLLSSPLSAELKLGDPAPPLPVTWMNGEGVDPAAAVGKAILVTYWESWAPGAATAFESLRALEESFAERGLVIVAVTDEAVSEIDAFATLHKLSFSIGLDPDHKSYPTWMDGVDAIPMSFLVGKDGRVVWRGDPLDDHLAAIIPKVLGGSYDPAQAKKIEELDQAKQKAIEEQNLEAYLASLDALIEADPHDFGRHIEKIEVGRDLDRLDLVRQGRESAGKAFHDDPEVLNTLAWGMVTDDDLRLRMPDLALPFAKRAAELLAQRAFIERETEARVLDTLARVYFELTLLDKAIETEKQALAFLANKEGEAAAPLQAALAHYEQVQELARREQAKRASPEKPPEKPAESAPK